MKIGHALILLLITSPHLLIDSPCTQSVDSDHDGWDVCTDDLATTTGTCDCDDSDASIHPEADEAYTDSDDDCDGVPEWRLDFSWELYGLDASLFNPAPFGDASILPQFNSGDVCDVSLVGSISSCHRWVNSSGFECGIARHTRTRDGKHATLGTCSTEDESAHTRCFILIDPETGTSVKENCEVPMDRYPFTDMIQTSDGGYVVSGARELPDDMEIASLMKLDANGSVVWAREYGEPYEERFAPHLSAITETSSGDLVTIGSSSLYTSSYIWVMRTSPEGNVKWNMSDTDLGELRLNHFITSQNESVILVGLTKDPTRDLVIAVNEEGHIKWRWDGPLDGTSSRAVVHPDGTITTTSTKPSYDYMTTLYTNRLTADGQEIWSGRDVTVELDSVSPNDIIVLSDGSYIITGMTNYYDSSSESSESAVIMRLDQEANPAPWSREVLEYP